MKQLNEAVIVPVCTAFLKFHYMTINNIMLLPFVFVHCLIFSTCISVITVDFGTWVVTSPFSADHYIFICNFC